MSATNTSHAVLVISALRRSVGAGRAVTEGPEYGAAVSLWNGATDIRLPLSRARSRI